DKEESRLLKRISQSPFTHPPRLEYAAWIEHQGDKSRAKQAKYLRLDVELAQFIEKNGEPQALDSKYARYSKRQHRVNDLYLSLDPAWRARVDRTLGIPPKLSARGKQAAQLILDFLIA